jgi:hypothetical protein
VGCMPESTDLEAEGVFTRTKVPAPSGAGFDYRKHRRRLGPSATGQNKSRRATDSAENRAIAPAPTPMRTTLRLLAPPGRAERAGAFVPSPSTAGNDAPSGLDWAVCSRGRALSQASRA